MFINLETSQIQTLSLGLIIKQAKPQYNNVFMNKLMNIYVYLCKNKFFYGIPTYSACFYDFALYH